MNNGISKKNNNMEWIYSFAITETSRHKKGFTVYKITSIVIPRNVPEALSCVTVWKRFREIKQLHKDLQKKAKELKIRTPTPELKASYFKRFHPDTIEERKDFIITLLNYAADNPGLFRSEPFVKFFESSVETDETQPDLGGRTKEGDEDEDETSQSSYCNDFTKDPLQSIHEKIFRSHAVTGDDSATNDVIARLTEEAKLDERLEDARISDIERRLKALSDHANIDYLYEAALKFTEAVEAESTAQYEKSFDAYKAGIEILLTGVKTDTDAERKKIVKDKVSKYLQRAEDIYENFVLKQKDDEPLMLVSSKSGDRDFVEITTNIERPLNYLSRFKVLKTVDGLQQIQDVTDKKVYMLKVIPKPHSMKASRMIYLPQESSYMVPLVAYCQTSDSIFLIMKLICGGKLWNYIQSYKGMHDSQSPRRSSEAQLFVEPKLGIVNSKSQVKVTNEEQVEVNSDTFSVLDSSQKLLQSISATLEKSKDMSVAEETEIDSDLDEGSIEEILKDIMGEGILNKPNDGEDENAIVKKLLQEVKEEEAEDLQEVVCEPKDPKGFEQDPVNDILDEIESDLQLDEILKDIPLVPETDPNNISPEASHEPLMQRIETQPNLEKTGSLNEQCSSETVPISTSNPTPQTIRLLPELTVVRYCAELVCAVEEFHASGIVCGDLNLNNVLLGPKGQLTLTYFYRNEARLAIPNEQAVEEFYVAPERPLTKRSDWWSVGVIMFELLVERRFYLCHPGKVEFYVELQIPEDVLISNEARELLEHMIEPNPEERYTFTQISSHEFFKSINWEEIRERGKFPA